ncbi:MAG: hypothetical protein Q9160_001809 [Pyrenula sp. 1 TL-2023]
MSTHDPPTSKTKWISLAQEEDGLINDISVHGINAMTRCERISASNIAFTPFLILRSIWQTKSAKEFKPSEWLLQQDLDAAKGFSNRSSWKNYIRRIEEHGEAQPKFPVPDIGMFTLVHHHQTQVGRLKKKYEPNQETPKIFHPQPSNIRPRSQNSDSSNAHVHSSELRDPFDKSPLASKGGQSGRASKGLFGENKSTRSSNREDIASQMGRLNIGDAGPDHSRREDEDAQTPESHMILDPESRATVSPLAAALTPAANDEQIVNVALMLLLNATTVSCPGVYADWNSHRRAFHIRNILEARTDGYLRHEAQDTPLAIVEVKRYVRSGNPGKVQMQESAQMACWIAEHPDKGDLPIPKNSKIKER